MGVKVWNEGEDSYGTTVTFSYPPGLSYRRATVSQVSFLLGRQPMAGGQQRLLFKAQAGAAVAQSLSETQGSGLVLVGETRLCQRGLAHAVLNSGHRVLRTLTVRNACPAGC